MKNLVKFYACTKPNIKNGGNMSNYCLRLGS